MNTEPQKKKESKLGIVSFVLSLLSPILVAVFLYFSLFPPLFFRIFQSILLEEGPILLRDILLFLFDDYWRAWPIIMGPLMEFLALFLGIKAITTPGSRYIFAALGILTSITVIIFIYYTIFDMWFIF